VTLLEQAPNGSLPVFRGEGWESHVSSALVVREGLEEHLWALAAICASVDRKFGQKSIPRFASEIGYSARRVWELAATYTAWESRERSRNPALSFQHHAIAARAEEPERAIEEAEDEGLSTRQLAARVKKDEEEGRTKTVVCSACGGRGRVPA
jgi:hypothetical protein